MFDQRAHERMIARQRARVRTDRISSGGRAARVHHHHWLACGPRTRRRLHEALGIAHLLHIDDDQLRRGIGHEEIDEIGQTKASLIARGNRVGDRQVAQFKPKTHMRHQPAALRQDRRARITSADHSGNLGR